MVPFVVINGIVWHIDGLAQDRRNPIANELGLRLSDTSLSI